MKGTHLFRDCCGFTRRSFCRLLRNGRFDEGLRSFPFLFFWLANRGRGKAINPVTTTAEPRDVLDNGVHCGGIEMMQARIWKGVVGKTWRFAQNLPLSLSEKGKPFEEKDPSPGEDLFCGNTKLPLKTLPFGRESARSGRRKNPNVPISF